MRLLTVLLVVALAFALAPRLAAQPVAKIDVAGVSDRDVEEDTTDIYTKASTGLPNVGVGEMIYLEGNPGDEEVTGWSWELTVPENSQAELSAADEAVVYFVPDMVGTFEVSLVVTSEEGESDPATLAVNAANYVGVGGIAGEAQFPQCAVCHGDKADEWGETGHAAFFTRAIDGLESDHYAGYCIRCHTVGYDADADNGGFDEVAADEGWEFPDTLVEGNWDDMVENYPNSAGLTNIQCEACHGPGSEHHGNVADNRIAVSMEVDVCAKCHDSGSHHTRPYQWDYSGHANATTYPTGAGHESCVRCHGGYGFVDYVNGVPEEERRTDYLPITCATCHDPHDATNEHQLRTTAAYTLENDVEVDFGVGNICANCHHSSRNAEEYVVEYHSHFGPHHSNQTDMLTGTNAIEYDGEIESSPHSRAVEEGCVGCHMAEGPAEGEDGYLQLGDHSFAMKTEEGVENVAVCAQCHGEIESFESIMADDDWDGDGDVESVEAEIEGMMTELALLLPPVGEPDVEVTEAYTQPQLKAAYNYLFVEEDGSHGIHNADYARGILQASLDDRDNLGVEPVDGVAPYEWSLSGAYPNPFNPATTFTYSLAEATPVQITVFSLTGREVQDLKVGFQQAGVYKQVVDLRNEPSGVYFINLRAGNFSAVRKMVLMR